MKKIFKCCFFFICLTGNGQTTESFDITSFLAPKGWKKETGNAYVSYNILDTQSGDYAKIAIYRCIAGSGNLKDDFDAEWNELVSTPYKTTALPETTEGSLPDNWKIKSGVAPFTFNNRQSAAILITASSNGTKVSMVLITNTDKYQQDMEAFSNSIKLNKAPAIQTITSGQNTNLQPVVNATYSFTTSNFNDGWISKAEPDYVLIEKGNHTVYLNYTVPYNASQFSGTGLRDAAFYWDNYVTKLFDITSKQYNDGSSMALKPPYMEGYAVEKSTGKSCFIGMYLLIVPNAVSVVIGKATNETEFRKLFPKANDPFESDLAAMTRYNKFAIAPADIIGKWQNGNTSTAHWYYISPSGYESYAGMTLAATSATFNFNKDGTYTSIHNGATGATGNMNTFQQEYKGNYSVTNWRITASKRYNDRTDNFDAFFVAVRGGRILHLNNGAGENYTLVKIK